MGFEPNIQWITNSPSGFKPNSKLIHVFDASIHNLPSSVSFLESVFRENSRELTKLTAVKKDESFEASLWSSSVKHTWIGHRYCRTSFSTSFQILISPFTYFSYLPWLSHSFFFNGTCFFPFLLFCLWRIAIPTVSVVFYCVWLPRKLRKIKH